MNTTTYSPKNTINYLKTMQQFEQFQKHWIEYLEIISPPTNEQIYGRPFKNS